MTCKCGTWYIRPSVFRRLFSERVADIGGNQAVKSNLMMRPSPVAGGLSILQSALALLISNRTRNGVITTYLN
jgi:hypothetical protein